MKKAFHIVYTLLALNFIIPVITYAVAPSIAVGQFADIGKLFGITYTHTEDSVLWWVLAIANVSTLGFCCLLLQVNLKKYYVCLIPLIFLKSMASLGFLTVYIFVEQFPAYLAAFLFDGITVFLMWFFATRAYKEITEAV